MGHGTLHIVSHSGVHTVAHNAIPGAGLGVDFLMFWEGQSNAVGQGDYAGTKQDLGYNHGTPFAAGIMNLYWGTSPTNFPIGPQTWLDSTTKTLQPYAAAGSSNIGPWLECAKYLVKYGGYQKVGVIEVAISGSSLRRARGPGAGFPSTPPEIFTQMITRVTQMEALFGRKVDCICTMEGETDAGDATDSANYQTSMTNYISTFRTTMNNPNCAYFVGQLNAATTFGPNQAAIRSAQAAYVATDTKSRLLNFDHIALNPDPHYDANGSNDVGDIFGAAIISYFKPAQNTNLGTGPNPWYQYASSGITAALGGTSTPRSGADAKDGDYEILVAASYSQGGAITLTTAAGFTQIGSTVTSTISGPITRTLAVFGRPVTTAILNANGGRMPNPTVDFGGSTNLNVARIFGFRNVNVTTPVNTSSTGANNANNTALTIAGGTASAANCLAVYIMCTAGATNKVNSVSIGSNLSNYQTIWDSKYNPGAGTVGVAMGTANITSAAAYGTGVVTFASTGVNVGMCVVLQP